MNGLTIIFILTVLGIGIYAWFTAPRSLAVLFIALIYAGLWFGMAGLMGKARPVALPKEEVRVIAYYLDEPNWIYLWVFEGEPTALRMGWNRETAEQLYGSGQQAEGQGVELLMRLGVPEGEMMFYPEPPLDNPPKP